MTKRTVSFKKFVGVLVLVAATTFTGCGSDAIESSSGFGGSGGTNNNSGGSTASTITEAGGRNTVTSTLLPDAPGTEVLSNEVVSLDISNVSDGYFTLDYSGGAEKVQIQITYPDGTMYPYPLNLGAPRVFPLTGGDGSYKVDVLEHVQDNMYSLGFSDSFSVSLTDEFRPFLYPNQYVEYTASSPTTTLAAQLSDKSADDLGYVANVYNYVIDNVVYDEELAANIGTNYIPDPASTLASKKGICFDYASLMSSLLRCQQVPTKLVVGYSGTAYHAWISVYISEIGWVDNIIEFDGSNWSLMDPTLAANKANSSSAVKEYVGDGSNYTVKYNY
ncbi:MAG: transglutaminase domain-containing protein [Lachnospiraceae bacterium]|nr:transglutaminase domain-containing protein [Lachnospiraceae bacterium]